MALTKPIPISCTAHPSPSTSYPLISLTSHTHFPNIHQTHPSSLYLPYSSSYSSPCVYLSPVFYTLMPITTSHPSTPRSIFQQPIIGPVPSTSAWPPQPLYPLLLMPFIPPPVHCHHFRMHESPMQTRPSFHSIFLHTQLSLSNIFMPITTPNPPNRLRSYLLHLMSSSAPISFIWNLN